MQFLKNNNTLSIVFLLLVFNLNAQQFPSRCIDTSEGLPNKRVESIFKDSRGILWVGTKNGLSKIENGHITNFFKSDGLAHNNTQEIIEDKFNTIWIASYGGGVTKFDGKTFSIFNKKKGLVNDYVRKLFEYKNKVYVGTKNGLSIINTQNDSISTVATDGIINVRTGKPDFQVMDFFVHKDEVYCGTYRLGIFKFSPCDKHLESVFNYQNDWDFLLSIQIKDSILYCGVDGANNPRNKGTLKKFETNKFLTDQKEDLLFGKSIIWDYATDSKENLYAAAWAVYTDDGGVYQIKDDTFIDRSQDFGVESGKVRCLFYDKKFNFLYVGTIDKGLYIVDLNENIIHFKNDEMDIIDIENLNQNSAILSTKGLTLIDFSKNTIQKQVPNSKFLEYLNNYFSDKPHCYKLRNHMLSDKTADDIVFYKIIAKDNTYWISSYFGLYQLDLEGKFLNYLPIRVQEFEFDYSNRLMYPIPYKDMNIVSDFKSKDWTLKNDKTKVFPVDDPNTPVSVSSFIKSNAKIYVATLYKGLFLYNGDTFTSYAKKNIFNELEINHLAINKESNNLLIATTSGSVYLAAITDGFKIVKRINKELIRGNSILFLEFYKGAILIGTDKGLTIYNEGIIQFIDTEQGLKNREFTSSKLIGNKLIIGTDNGYYQVKLNKILNPPHKELFFKINALTVNNQTLKKEDLKWFKHTVNTLELNQDQNVLSIDYIASNQPYPNKLLYSYQIKGLHDIWSKYSDKSLIQFPYLPSGEFDLNVKTKDLNSGIISSSQLLHITVAPFFWETWWFRMILLAVLLGSIVIIQRIRLSKIKNQEVEKVTIRKRLVETKLEALQSQMNPHFTFNAMNSIQNYIIDNDIDNALMYLSEFAKLIRQTLQNSSKQLITLAEEINYLKSYTSIENMRFNNKIRITFTYEDLAINKIRIPPMLLQPFVENVFVHAFDKHKKNPMLTICFSKKQNILHCEIMDNGKGMGKTTSGQMHESKGLKLVSERLNLLNKKNFTSIKVSSKIGEGTRVLVRLQL